MRKMITKDQEREALKKIREIVEPLGEESYIGFAFKGVLQDAEENIENDFLCSQYNRAGNAENRAEKAEKELAAANKRIEELGRLLHSLTNERKDLEHKLAEQTLPEWLRIHIHTLVTEDSITARERMESAAENMEALADMTGDIAFAEAVKSYRTARDRRDHCERILYGLNKMQPKN